MNHTAADYEDSKAKGFPQVTIKLAAPQDNRTAREKALRPIEGVDKIHDLVVLSTDGTTFVGIDQHNTSYRFELADLHDGDRATFDDLFVAFMRYARHFHAPNGVHGLRIYADKSGGCDLQGNGRFEHHKLSWDNVYEGIFLIDVAITFNTPAMKH